MPRAESLRAEVEEEEEEGLDSTNIVLTKYQSLMNDVEALNHLPQC